MKEEIIKNLNEIEDKFVLNFINEYIKRIVKLTNKKKI